MKRDRRAGFSLLEILIVSIILAVVILITLNVLMSTTKIYTNESITSDLEERGRNFTEFYKTDMLYCKVILLAADGSSIQYQMPLTNAANGAAVFGYKGPLNVDQVGWKAELRFVPKEVFREQNGPVPAGFTALPTFFDSSGQFDFNHDNDLGDTFIRGEIQYKVFDNLGVEQKNYESVASDKVMVRYNAGALNGDVDNDGVLDPIFAVIDANGTLLTTAQIAASGSEIMLTAWHGEYDELRKGFFMKKTKTTFKFRNKQ